MEEPTLEQLLTISNLYEFTEAARKVFIEHKLKEHNGHVKNTAANIGIRRTYLQTLMKQLNITWLRTRKLSPTQLRKKYMI